MGKEDEEMSEEVCPYHNWRLKDDCSACKDEELTYFLPEGLEGPIYMPKHQYDHLHNKCERYRQALLKIAGRVGMRIDEIRFSNPDQLHSFAEAYRSIAEKALDE